VRSEGRGGLGEEEVQLALHEALAVLQGGQIRRGGHRGGAGGRMDSHPPPHRPALVCNRREARIRGGRLGSKGVRGNAWDGQTVLRANGQAARCCDRCHGAPRGRAQARGVGSALCSVVVGEGDGVKERGGKKETPPRQQRSGWVDGCDGWVSASEPR